MVCKLLSFRFYGSDVSRMHARMVHYSVSWCLCRPGRPSIKKGTGDRKSGIRQRRLLGKSVAEMSGIDMRGEAVKELGWLVCCDS